MLIGVAWLLLRLIAMYSNYLKLTNKRVYIKTGLLSKTEIDIRLNKLDGVNVERPLLQRLLGCGYLTVRSSGANAIQFGPVQDPDKIRAAISDAADEVQ